MSNHIRFSAQNHRTISKAVAGRGKTLVARGISRTILNDGVDASRVTHDLVMAGISPSKGFSIRQYPNRITIKRIA